jgi:hypothetical protein
MKLLFVALFVVLVTSVGRAGPAERTVLAAMKLSDLPNYSWTSTIADDARTYQIEGKTQRGNCTWLHMPMVVSLARRLGPRAGGEIEAFFRGNERCVIHTGRGWQTPDELPREHWSWTDADEWRFSRPNESARWALAGGRGPSADPCDPFAQLLQGAPKAEKNETPVSIAQFGVSHPHEELGVIVSCLTDLQVDGDGVAGTLSDLGAQLLLVRDGQEDITPLQAAGGFRLQIKDGVVVGYALRLAGIIAVDGRRRLVHQYSQTVVKDIGTTRFEAPDEAKRKLGLE